VVLLRFVGIGHVRWTYGPNGGRVAIDDLDWAVCIGNLPVLRSLRVNFCPPVDSLLVTLLATDPQRLQHLRTCPSASW